MFRFSCAGRGCANASLRSHQILMLCALAFLCLSILSLGVLSNFDALAMNNIAHASSSDGIVESNIYPLNYFNDKTYSATSSSFMSIVWLESLQFKDNYNATKYNNLELSLGSVYNNTFILTAGSMFKGSAYIGLSNSSNSSTWIQYNTTVTYSVYVSNVANTNIVVGGSTSTALVEGINTITRTGSHQSYINFACNSSTNDGTFTLHWIKVELGSEFTGFVKTDYYNFGYNQGVSSVDSQSYYDAGYDAGYDDGLTSSDAYQEGYNAGEIVGYQDGYDAGWDAGSERSYIDNLPLALYIPNQQYAEFGDFLDTSAFTYNGVSYSGNYSDQSFEINDVYRYEFTADSGDSPCVRFTSSFTGSIFNVSFGVDTHAWYNSLRGVLFKSNNYSYYYDLASNNAVFSSIADSTRRCTYYSLSVSGLSLDSYYIYILFDNSVLTGDYYMACLVLPYSVSCDSADDSLTLQQVYEQGYNDGVYVGSRDTRAESWQEGYSSGYGAGYNDGVDGSEYTFLSLFGAVIDAPIQAFNGLFNFEILGVNMRTFLLAVLTLAIGLFIWKIIVRGG